ncbi:MAG: SAM-dependent chlorinase/fluorinase [Candidatus Omnitrophica bacterium]|nr:SAM-dependent chlorinase/fluorinase [Candidatus Omnitrophota bacterium]
MRLISLITDFGLKDNFVGLIKAVILKINPKVKIVDISHLVKPQDIKEAAFILKSSFYYFPKGTVHLVIVDPGVGTERKKLLVKTKNYFFVAPDNGVLAPTLKKEKPIKIIQITNPKYFLKPVSYTFHGRDIFAVVSAYVAKGDRLERFGKRIDTYLNLDLPQLKIKKNELIGQIIYIDRFGNLVSNIDGITFNNFVKNKGFKIFIKDKVIERLSYSYQDVAGFKPLAIIDSFGYLEIALNSGSAKDYLKAKEGSLVKVMIN